MRFLISLAAAAIGSFVSAQTTIHGQVSTAATTVPVHVFSIPCGVIGDSPARHPSKRAIFAAASQKGSVRANAQGEYQLAVEVGHHAVFAFADLNRSGTWDPAVPEPFGWYAAEPGGRFDPVECGAAGAEASFSVSAPRHFPTRRREVEGGSLRHVKGYPVLELRGDARARGHAHGFLCAPQIVDFFRYYILEDKFRSGTGYDGGFAGFLNANFRLPPEYLAECEALIQGMRESGEPLEIPELGRDFSLTDLFAINSYIETRAMASHCTQFGAWGPRTTGTDVEGGTITGRNMDGECDLRRVTVSHFLLIAVEPNKPRKKRYVSMMWPGFIGTISGMNEDGFYTMENAGITGPGPVVDGLVPVSWTMRETLAHLGSDATPSSVLALCMENANAVGGFCGPGCVTFCAVPNAGQDAPVFVIEGDRFGQSIRRAADARPFLEHCIVGSNHFHSYGVRKEAPGLNFDVTPGFSTKWRYEAGMHKLEAWDRIDRKIGTEAMRELLQTVAHGTTEYAVITRPGTREFDVARASMKAELWDAPYREWTRFHFDDLFETPRAPAAK